MTRRLESPAAGRNMAPIGERLGTLLPPTGLVLELASGPGQHAVAFTEQFETLRWQPSDVDERALASIEAWRATVQHERIAAPLRIDLTSTEWPTLVQDSIVAVVAINVCHISPIAATAGILAGAGQLLATSAPLLIYGPFMRDGAHTAPSNAAFDQSLRGQDPSWGVRDVGELNQLANVANLSDATWHNMPSNNALLEFRKR